MCVSKYLTIMKNNAICLEGKSFSGLSIVALSCAWHPPPPAQTGLKKERDFLYCRLCKKYKNVFVGCNPFSDKSSGITMSPPVTTTPCRCFLILSMPYCRRSCRWIQLNALPVYQSNKQRRTTHGHRAIPSPKIIIIKQKYPCYLSTQS